MTFDYILSEDRQLNKNCEYNYRIIPINILLLPVRRLGKMATIS